MPRPPVHTREAARQLLLSLCLSIIDLYLCATWMCLGMYMQCMEDREYQYATLKVMMHTVLLRGDRVL